RTAPGGVGQRRLVAEPPLAVARAADAAGRRASVALHREIQARLPQRGRLSRAGGAYDHVPRERRERATAVLQVAENVEALLHLLLHRRDLAASIGRRARAQHATHEPDDEDDERDAEVDRQYVEEIPVEQHADDPA